MENELTQLRAQVNALSRAWLVLAAAVDMRGGLPANFEQALLGVHWPGQAWDDEARKTMGWLVEQHQLAQSRREPQSGQ